MKCPHCQKAFHSNKDRKLICHGTSNTWYTINNECPTCNKIIIHLSSGYNDSMSYNEVEKYLVFPKSSAVTQAPNEVPKHIAEDFNEAGLILNDSPKASAALSRRCLQTILREMDGIKSGSLDSEIHQSMKVFPSYIADAIDAIRNIGNFAAHPKKSEATGEIVPVEPGEAEWALEVIEQLFDFCYVQPKVLKEKRIALNAKLADIGKPPMKSASGTK